MVLAVKYNVMALASTLSPDSLFKPALPRRGVSPARPQKIGNESLGAKAFRLAKSNKTSAILFINQQLKHLDESDLLFDIKEYGYLSVLLGDIYYFNGNISDIDNSIAAYSNGIIKVEAYVDQDIYFIRRLIHITHFHRGRANLFNKDYDSAIRDFDIALCKETTIYEDNLLVELYTFRADALYKARRFDDAIEDFERAIAIDDTVWEDFAGLAFIYHVRELSDRVIEFTTKALLLNNSAPLLNNIRGEAFSRKRDYLSAIEEFKVAVRLNPDDASAYGLWAEACLHLSNYNESIELFKRSQNDKSYFFDGQFVVAYAGIGQFTQALAFYESTKAADENVETEMLLDAVEHYIIENGFQENKVGSLSQLLLTMLRELDTVDRSKYNGILSRIFGLFHNLYKNFDENKCLKEEGNLQDAVKELFARIAKLPPKQAQRAVADCHAVLDAGHATEGNTTGMSFTPAGAEITAAPEPPPPPLNDAELAALTAHAIANPWKRDAGKSASTVVGETFKEWLKRGITRADLVKALEKANQGKLIDAYSADVRRNPERRLKGLYVKPHKLSADAPTPLSLRRVADLSGKELAEKREFERLKKAKQRAAQRNM